jgi:glutathionylspermidine synthase
MGVVLTTMPITMIGDAFASSWDERERLEVAARVQAALLERGLEVNADGSHHTPASALSTAVVQRAPTAHTAWRVHCAVM